MVQCQAIRYHHVFGDDTMEISTRRLGSLNRWTRLIPVCPEDQPVPSNNNGHTTTNITARRAWRHIPMTQADSYGAWGVHSEQRHNSALSEWPLLQIDGTDAGRAGWRRLMSEVDIIIAVGQTLHWLHVYTSRQNRTMSWNLSLRNNIGGCD